jgi:hypothetical protein
VIDWKKVIPEWPIFGVSKGEITSTTSDPVFYAVIPLTLGFQEMLPDPDHPNQSRSGALVTVQNASFAVGRISPDDPYVIYFLNRTKYLVNIVLPPEGKTQDFSKTGDDFEKKIPLKPGRTTGLHLAPAMETKSPPAPPPQAPSPPNTPEKK